MPKTKKSTFRLSTESMEVLEEIKSKKGLPSLNAALDFVISGYSSLKKEAYQQSDIQHNLELMKKYLNEIRRDNYITHSLLNAMTLKMDISIVPVHHQKAFRSPALVTALKNRAEYMQEIMTRIESQNISAGDEYAEQ